MNAGKATYTFLPHRSHVVLPTLDFLLHPLPLLFVAVMFDTGAGIASSIDADEADAVILASAVILNEDGANGMEVKVLSSSCCHLAPPPRLPLVKCCYLLSPLSFFQPSLAC